MSDYDNHIVCIGAVYIDTILTVPHFPIEDEKLRAKKLIKRRGGNPANTLEVLQQLNSHAGGQNAEFNKLHLCSVLPAKESAAKHFIQQSLPGVDIDGSAVFREGEKEAASSYIIQNEQTLSRTIVSINQLSEMTAEEFGEKVLQMARNQAGLKWEEPWFHFEGRIPEFTAQCMRFLRKEFPECRISVECENPERTGMGEVARMADVVFYSKLWATKWGFEDARSFLQAQLKDARDGAVLCCTWGAEGAAAVEKFGVNIRWAEVKGWQQKREKQRQVVDTIGAGDTFIAGMLYALNDMHDGWDLQLQISFANELAGRKVRQEGFGDLGRQMMTRFKS
ncbi:uncharacterized protein N0V89_003180 [Didymosphaeria variabile]|uniref:Carbohydrate kinase PfkB domain-containing protein n=1 Tax=Didymosphaeria variabile TaxID=1932322 RepID=A0A9W9CEB8_9PLEO|nr:uncharacterized protein N0V89_003180 [Didymosphaeria variabile]KAJ4358596.1 hypothetical protein N0V89_003180 [Didymosphaeria variabile]